MDDTAHVLGSVASKRGLFGSLEISLDGSPSCCVFPLRCPEAALFSALDFPSGLQVPVPFKAFGSRSHNTSHGG